MDNLGSRDRLFSIGVRGGNGVVRPMLCDLRHESSMGDIDFVYDVEGFAFRVQLARESRDVPLNAEGLRLLAALLNAAAADIDARDRG